MNFLKIYCVFCIIVFILIELCIYEGIQKAKRKYADKIKAKYCVVIGDSEIDEDKIQIKFMEKSEQLNVKLSNIKDEILKLLKEKV